MVNIASFSWYPWRKKEKKNTDVVGRCNGHVIAGNQHLCILCILALTAIEVQSPNIYLPFDFIGKCLKVNREIGVTLLLIVNVST